MQRFFVPKQVGVGSSRTDTHHHETIRPVRALHAYLGVSLRKMRVADEPEARKPTRYGLDFCRASDICFREPAVESIFFMMLRVPHLLPN